MTAEGQNLIDSSSIGDLFSFKRGIGFGLSVHQTTRKKHRLVGLGLFFFFLLRISPYLQHQQSKHSSWSHSPDLIFPKASSLFYV